MSEEKATLSESNVESTTTDSVASEAQDTATANTATEKPDQNPQDLQDNDSQKTNDLQAQLDAAKTKADENWDLLLRSRAEMDNLRRRAERDVESAHRFALEKFIAQLLPVMDSLELGLSAVGKDDHEQLQKLHEGTELTLKMFADVLKKFNVEEIHPLDEAFNPELHQAMVMQESDEKAPNTVLMVMQKGYTLNNRLVRPAMVAVSKANSSEPGEKLDEKA